MSPSDAAGCERVAQTLGAAKRGGTPVFPGGVARRFQELRTMAPEEMATYSVVFVPSLANAPYDLLRAEEVSGRLSLVVTGRIAVWSGSPDRGRVDGKSSGKLDLIVNLARWAAADYRRSGTGMVVLQDFSDPAPGGASRRYDWIPDIAGVRVVASADERTYKEVRKTSSNPAADQIAGSLGYDNMASFGLVAPVGPVRIGAVGAVGAGGNQKDGAPILLTFDPLAGARAPGASFSVSSTTAFAVASTPSIDILPSTINYNTTNLVQVRVFSSVSFDAASIDPATVRFVVDSVLPGAPVGTFASGLYMASVSDLNGDGLPDRNLQFRMTDLKAAGLSGPNHLFVVQGQAASGPFQASDPSPPPVVSYPAVTQVKIVPDSATVAVGDTVDLDVQLFAGSTPVSGRIVVWSSLDAAATVNSSGLVTGQSAGSARIVATSEGKADTAIVTVTGAAGTAPTAVADSYSASAGTTLTVPDGATDLLANDALGSPAATLVSFGGGSLGGAVTDHAAGSTATFGTGGSLTVNANGSFTFTPATGFTGSFTFQYRITNASGSSDATVTISVTATGVAPSAVADVYSTPAGTTLTVPDSTTDLLANDNLGTPAATLVSFGGGSLGGAVTDHAAGSTATFGTGGSLTVNANGSFSFTPATGFTGAFTFQYRITNPSGSSDATVTINVNGAAPSAVADAYNVAAGGTLTVPDGATDLLGNDALGTPAATLVSFGGGSLGGAVTDRAAGTTATFGTGGSLTVNANGSFTFTPATGFTGSFTFQYRITNSSGSSDATVTITVNGTGPTANNDAYTVAAGATLTVPDGATDVLANDSLGNPAATLVSFGGGSLGGAVTDRAAGATATFGTGGSLTVNANGSFTFTPSAGFVGSFTFQYRITNAAGSSDGTVTITVTGTAPTAVADPGYFVNSGSTLSVPAGTGVLANDNRGNPLANVTSFGGGSLGGAVTDRAAGTTATFGTGGSLTVNADGSFTFTPASGFSGNFTFSYRLTNAVGFSDAIVTIEVRSAPAAVADGPAAGSAPASAFHTPFNTTLVTATPPNAATPSLLANDNLGFPAATITSFGGGSLGGAVTDRAAGTTATFGTGGSLTVNANGTLSFTPSTGFTGLFTFSYRLHNPAGDSDALVTIAVGARPAAVNDTYGPTLIGNVPINTARAGGTGFGALGNDQGDALIATLVSATNGVATVNPNGTFTFAPTPGFEGAASITYKVSNGFGDGPGNATVALTVGEPIWFVNASATNGNGTLPSPFNCLTGAGCLSAAAHDVNDRIFLYSGGYTGGFTLQNGERLIGQGATATLSSVAGLTWPADAETEPGTNGAAPTITSSGIAAVTLTNAGAAGSNLLRGFSFGNVGATGTALAGTSFGTVTVSEVGINTNGQALSLTTGTLNGGFAQLRSTGGTNNVLLSGVATTGTSTLGADGDALSGATGDAFVVAGGTGSFTYPGSITQASNAALLNVSGGHTGTLTFQTGTLSATNGTGLQFNNADGSYVFTGTPTLNGGNAGIDVTNGSSGTFTFPTAASITNPTAETVVISGSAPTFTYAGSLTKTNAGTGITLSSNTGGTLAFNGATKVFSTGSANAVNMLSNAAGVTVSFADSLRITTTTGVGFNATGGGTVTVAGTHNSITAAGGVALNVASTTIGAGGLNFRSISATGGSSGIVLNSTGSAGRLQVTGSGTASSGGTIQSTTGHGISLTSTTNPAFDRMNLQSNGGSGVFGTGVVGFTLTNSTIATSGTGGGANASNIDFFADVAAGTENNLSGVVTITGNTLSAPAFHSVDIQNWSGTISDLTLSNNTITNNSTLGGGIRVIAIGGAGNVAKITRATIAGNQITGTMQSPGLQVQCGNASASGPLGECGTEGSATNVVAITNNQVRGTSAAARIGTEGLLALLNGRGQANFNVSTNDVRHTTGRAMAVTVFGQGRMTSTVSNNTIVANNTFAAAALEIGADSTANMASFASYRATVTGNNISQSDGVGIYAIARGSSDSLRVKLQNNIIAAPLTGVRPGLRVDSGSTNSNTWVCANISGNTSAGSGGHPGIGLRKQGTVPTDDAFAVHGMAATSSPGVESYVSGLNPAGGGVLLISATSGFTNCSFP